MADIDTMLAEVKRLDGEATPGEWHHDPVSLWACCTTERGGCGRVVCTVDAVSLRPASECAADAALIAYYRTAAPALAREVQRLTAERDGMAERNRMLTDRLHRLEDAMIDSDYLEANGGCDCERCFKLRGYLAEYGRQIQARLAAALEDGK